MAVFDIYGNYLLPEEILRTNPLYIDALSRGEQKLYIDWYENKQKEEYQNIQAQIDRLLPKPIVIPDAAKLIVAEKLLSDKFNYNLLDND